MMEILAALEASRFAMFVKESNTGYVATLAFHSIGMAFLVGISGATALRILGVARSLPLAPMEDFFPLMYAGFWINAVTGVVLLTLYPTKFLTDGLFYFKLAAIVMAVVTIRRLVAHVFRDEASLETAAGAKKAKLLAGTLLAVWGVAVLAGRLTAYTFDTRIQTIFAVFIFTIVMLLAGYVVARLVGWIEPSGQGRVTTPSVTD